MSETEPTPEEKYDKLHGQLSKAERHGRIDGRYRCPVCGQRFMTFDEADGCCKLPKE
jgi:hypothetical protein